MSTVYHANENTVRVGVQIKVQPQDKEDQEAEKIEQKLAFYIIETLQINVAICCGQEDQNRQEESLQAWKPFFDLISSIKTLKTVRLLGIGQRRHFIFKSFLLAIQANTSIQHIELDDVKLHSSDICDFIDNACSVTRFTMTGNMNFVDNDKEEATRNIANALQRNKNVQFLELKEESLSSHPIVLNLRSKQNNLESLSLESTRSFAEFSQ